MDVKKLIEEVKAMTVVELNDLVKALEEEFGVSAAAPVAVAGAAGAARMRLPQQRRRRNSTSYSKISARTKSALSKWYANSPVSVLRKRRRLSSPSA